MQDIGNTRTSQIYFPTERRDNTRVYTPSVEVVRPGSSESQETYVDAEGNTRYKGSDAIVTYSGRITPNRVRYVSPEYFTSLGRGNEIPKGYDGKRGVWIKSDNSGNYTAINPGDALFSSVLTGEGDIDDLIQYNTDGTQTKVFDGRTYTIPEGVTPNAQAQEYINGLLARVKDRRDAIEWDDDYKTFRDKNYDNLAVLMDDTPEGKSFKQRTKVGNNLDQDKYRKQLIENFIAGYYNNRVSKDKQVELPGYTVDIGDYGPARTYMNGLEARREAADRQGVKYDDTTTSEALGRQVGPAQWSSLDLFKTMALSPISMSLNYLSPSQYFGAFRALNSNSPFWGNVGNYFNSLSMGNSGILDEETAKQHPLGSFFLNVGADALTGWGLVRRFNPMTMGRDLRNVADYVQTKFDFGHMPFDNPNYTFSTYASSRAPSYSYITASSRGVPASVMAEKSTVAAGDNVAQAAAGKSAVSEESAIPALTDEQIEKARQRAIRWHTDRINSKDWEKRVLHSKQFTKEEVPVLREQLLRNLQKTRAVSTEQFCNDLKVPIPEKEEATRAWNHVIGPDNAEGATMDNIYQNVALLDKNISYDDAVDSFIHEYGHSLYSGYIPREGDPVINAIIEREQPLVARAMKYNSKLAPTDAPLVMRSRLDIPTTDYQLLHYYGNDTEKSARGYVGIYNILKKCIENKAKGIPTFDLDDLTRQIPDMEELYMVTGNKGAFNMYKNMLNYGVPLTLAGGTTMGLLNNDNEDSSNEYRFGGNIKYFR